MDKLNIFQSSGRNKRIKSWSRPHRSRVIQLPSTDQITPHSQAKPHAAITNHIQALFLKLFFLYLPSLLADST